MLPSLNHVEASLEILRNEIQMIKNASNIDSLSPQESGFKQMTLNKHLKSAKHIRQTNEGK